MNGEPTALRVDYEDAEDLLSDYAENMASGTACIANNRELPVGAEIQLVLAFPGLVEPIRIAAIVRWSKGGAEPTLGIELEPTAREELANVIARVRDRDPAVVRRPLRVLVVEDNPHVGELLRHALNDRRNLGPKIAVDCRLVGDGPSALEELHRAKYDLLIVDVYLPVFDGPKLITIVREEMGPRVPIIAVSAGGDSARRAAMAAGANIFIDKPMRLRGVIDTMRSIMNLDVSP